MKRFCLAAAVVALTGCPSDPPSTEPAASVTTATASAPRTRPTASAKVAKPRLKSTKSTKAEELGTLPEGVGLAVGTTAPDFLLEAHSRGKQSLDSLLQRGEVLLVFYRGGW